MRLQNQLKNSRFDVQHHQLLCEKQVTEALNEEDRLKGFWDFFIIFDVYEFRDDWQFEEQIITLCQFEFYRSLQSSRTGKGSFFLNLIGCSNFEYFIERTNSR